MKKIHVFLFIFLALILITLFNFEKIRLIGKDLISADVRLSIYKFLVGEKYLKNIQTLKSSLYNVVTLPKTQYEIIKLDKIKTDIDLRLPPPGKTLRIKKRNFF